MLRTPYWGDAPELWDSVKIGGVTLPGTAYPSGRLSRAIDSQPIPGDDTGGTQTDLGYEGARVTIQVVMWEQEHLDAFITFSEQFRPKKGEKKPNPVDVLHPALSIMGIRALTIESISIPQRSQQTGLYESTIDLLEFIPEIKKPAAPKSSTLKDEPESEATATKPKKKAATKKKDAGEVKTLLNVDTSIEDFETAFTTPAGPKQSDADNKAKNLPTGPAIPKPGGN